MSASPDRQQYLRSPDYYGTAELSAYAREILTRGCSDQPYSKQLTVSWETPSASINLHCSNLEQEFPHYQLNARQKESIGEVEYSYMFDANQSEISMYFVKRDLSFQKLTILTL